MTVRTAPAPRTFRSRLAWGAVGLYVVLVLIGLRLISDVAPLSLVDLWVYFALLWAGVIGALIVSRDAGHPVGWLFMAIALSFALGLFTEAYSIHSLIGESTPLPATELAVWISFWISMPGIAALALFLPLLFPDGHLPSPRWRCVAWAAGALLALAVGVQMFAPDAYTKFPNIRNPLGVAAWAEPFALFNSASDVALFALIFITAVAMVQRLRRATTEERLQIRWFTFAAGFLVLAFVVDALSAVVTALAALTPFLSAIAVTAIPTAVGIAILRYRLYDIDIIINRTLVYVTLTGVLAGMYTAAVALFQRVIVATTGQSSDIAIVLTLFILATVFTPIKNTLQSTADRYLKPVASGHGGGGTSIDDLTRLAELHGRGILTDDEFAAKKKQVLGI
jgi:hypothetical protein